MPIAGYVRSTGGSSVIRANEASNMGGPGGTAYNAIRADGQRIGMFQTAGQAQQALSRSLGNLPIIWTQSNVDGVESYVGRGGTPDMRDIWGADLEIWHDAGLGIRKGGLSSIRHWSDRSGNSRPLLQGTTALQPTLTSSDPVFNGRPAVALSSGGPSYMSYSGWALGLVPPFTLIVVANATAALGSLIATIAGGSFSLGVDASRQWSVNNGAVITGPLASSNSADIVVVQQTAAACTVRVNGSQVGSNALVAAAGTPRLSSAVAASAYNGSVVLIALASVVDASVTKVLQAERFCAEQYQH